MMIDVQSLGLDQMTVVEKLQLVDIILDTLPEQVDRSEISDEQMAEIMQRRDHAEANPGQGRPWREVIADLRRKL